MSDASKPRSPLPVIGWKEEVHLPELHTVGVVAKVDTGARSSALHADAITVKGKRVSFRLGSKRHVLKLAGLKRIKSSNGHSEMRPMIETTVILGVQRFEIAITLTDRTDMEVPMLLGREVIKGRFLVNAARSFMLSRKAKLK